MTEFVELPEDHPQLLYSNIVCGVIRGALEMVSQDIYHTQTSSQLSVLVSSLIPRPVPFSVA